LSCIKNCALLNELTKSHEFLKILEKFEQPGWTIVRDSQVVAPYAFRDREWIGYDDVPSITLKAQWAMSMKLGGGFFWSVETDDFRGHHSGEKYPLIKTLVRTLNDGQLPPPPPTTTEDVSWENYIFYLKRGLSTRKYGFVSEKLSVYPQVGFVNKRNCFLPKNLVFCLKVVYISPENVFLSRKMIF